MRDPTGGNRWTRRKPWTSSDAERLEILLHKTRYSEDVLESTKQFIIKEPYFTLTEQGEPTLRIDHPSDLVICHEEGTKDWADAAAA